MTFPERVRHQIYQLGGEICKMIETSRIRIPMEIGENETSRIRIPMLDVPRWKWMDQRLGSVGYNPNISHL